MAGKVLPAPTAVWDMAERLLTCVRLSLAETEDGSPAHAYAIPGSEVAWDYCHCGGQLTVHVRTMYPSETFPGQKLEGDFTDGCPATWLVAEFVVTILRCVPVQDGRGKPPSAEEQHEAARLDFADRHAVRRGVVCCFADEDRRAPTPRLLQEQLAVGHEGQCAGSELHVLVGFRMCEEC